jgi:hypothetical protein
MPGFPGDGCGVFRTFCPAIATPGRGVSDTLLSFAVIECDFLFA